MILLSDELWLIANNSINFTNRRCIKEVCAYRVDELWKIINNFMSFPNGRCIKEVYAYKVYGKTNAYV